MNLRTWRWWVIRLELAMATAAPIMIAFLAIASPRFTGGMFGSPSPVDPQDAAYTLGFALSLIGAAWAWRIWLADLEAGTPRWRYRRRG